MLCPHCNQPISDDARFCPACGAKLDDPSSDKAPASPTPPGPKRRVLPIAVAVVVVLVAVLGIFVVLPMVLGGSGGSGGGAGASGRPAYYSALDPDKYSLQEAQLDLDDCYEFEFPLNDGIDMTFDSFDQIGNTNPYDAVRVYTDSSFSHEFPTTVSMFESDDGENALYVSPADPRVRDENGNDTDAIDIFHLDDAESDEFVPLGRWYGFGGYYLVRYIGSDGEKLDKPEVTYFTVANDVDKDEDALAEPDNVQISVTGTGTLSVSWAPVEGPTTTRSTCRPSTRRRRAPSTATPTTCSPRRRTPRSIPPTTTPTPPSSTR